MRDIYSVESGWITVSGQQDIMFVLNYLIIADMNI